MKTKKISKRNKLFGLKIGSLLIAVLIMVSVFAVDFGNQRKVLTHGTSSIATRDTSGVYTTSDLQIGDYIDNFGTWQGDGLKWRVIDKDATNGTLVRLDYLLPDQNNSNDNVFLVDQSEDAQTQAYINDDIEAFLADGSKTPYINTRKGNGTNYWEQSVIKKR